jgi:hypothetical protein
MPTSDDLQALRFKFVALLAVAPDLQKRAKAAVWLARTAMFLGLATAICQGVFLSAVPLVAMAQGCFICALLCTGTKLLILAERHAMKVEGLIAGWSLELARCDSLLAEVRELERQLMQS